MLVILNRRDEVDQVEGLNVSKRGAQVSAGWEDAVFVEEDLVKCEMTVEEKRNF